MAKSTVTLDSETKNLLRQIENKMTGMTGLADSLKEGLQNLKDMKDMFATPDGSFFFNIGNSLASTLHQIKADEQVDSNAMADNKLAMYLGGGSSPEKGSSEFYQQVYASTPVSPAETQAAALKATFSDSSVLEQFKNMMAGAIGGSVGNKSGNDDLGSIIKSATKSDADDRTFGEKVLDQFAIGRGINKFRNWRADRDVKKEEKAEAKDKGIIKREQKEMDRLNAKYRKMKKEGASDEEIAELRESYMAHKEKQEAAATRISERNNDDLVELGAAKPSVDDRMSGLMSMLMKSLAPTPQASQNIATPGSQLSQNTATPGSVLSGASSKIDMSKKMDTSKAVDTEIVAPDGVRAKDITGDKAEPVELAKETSGSLTKTGDGKEAADIQRNLDTRLRPDFYKEGTAFFKKGNSGSLFDSLTEGLGSKLGGLGKSLGKGGLYAALGVASIASLAKIGQAAGLVKDWWKARGDAKKTRDAIHDQGAAAHQNMKKGWNDELRDAYSELEMAEKALDNTWLFDGKEKKRLEEAKRKVEREKKKMQEFQKAREAAGIDVNDNKAMNEFKKKWTAEQKAKAKAALAPGSTQQATTPNATTPGASTKPEKAETAEEQAKRVEEATYTGTKKALLDSDVQKQNEANAKTTGQQIDQSLVGRK